MGDGRERRNAVDKGQVAAILEDTGNLLELTGGNPFDVKPGSEQPGTGQADSTRGDGEGH